MPCAAEIRSRIHQLKPPAFAESKGSLFEGAEGYYDNYDEDQAACWRDSFFRAQASGVNSLICQLVEEGNRVRT